MPHVSLIRPLRLDILQIFILHLYITLLKYSFICLFVQFSDEKRVNSLWFLMLIDKLILSVVLTLVFLNMPDILKS